MNYSVSKEFHFSASHQLTHLPDDHPCARLHGHNYTVVIELVSPMLDANGFVIDYGKLDVFKQWIDDTLDHRHLNDVLGSSEDTTAERLAVRMFTEASMRLNQREGLVDVKVNSVTVCETPKTAARYQP